MTANDLKNRKRMRGPSCRAWRAADIVARRLNSRRRLPSQPLRGMNNTYHRSIAASDFDLEYEKVRWTEPFYGRYDRRVSDRARVSRAPEMCRQRVELSKLAACVTRVKSRHIPQWDQVVESGTRIRRDRVCRRAATRCISRPCAAQRVRRTPKQGSFGGGCRSGRARLAFARDHDHVDWPGGEG
jgi:hypothetical protein